MPLPCADGRKKGEEEKNRHQEVFLTQFLSFVCCNDTDSREFYWRILDASIDHDSRSYVKRSFRFGTPWDNRNVVTGTRRVGGTKLA